ncbi:MAG: DUF1049 domain-containing protein [Betaproteobacteria bacterium]|nr:DUF1049 domain-containing protein [Betaproteobacteria bacterium]
MLRAFIFTALFVLALKNTEPVTLQSYFEQSWRLPLVLLLLVFFVAGAGFGIVACLSKIFIQRREIQVLKHRLGMTAATDQALSRRDSPHVVP